VDEITIVRYGSKRDGATPSVHYPLSTLPSYDSNFEVKRGTREWKTASGSTSARVGIGGGLLVPGRVITNYVSFVEVDGFIEVKRRIDPVTMEEKLEFVTNEDDVIATFTVTTTLVEVAGKYNVQHTWTPKQSVRAVRLPSGALDTKSVQCDNLTEAIGLQAEGAGVNYQLHGEVIQSLENCTLEKD